MEKHHGTDHNGVVGALLVAVPSSASVLYTPLVDVSGSHLGCSSINVTTKPLAVTVDWVDFTGTTRGTASYTLSPGAARLDSLAGITALFCRFTVAGSKSSIRAASCVGSPCQATVEAH
jgi:hypothetical protein